MDLRKVLMQYTRQCGAQGDTYKRHSLANVVLALWHHPSYSQLLHALVQGSGASSE